MGPTGKKVELRRKVGVGALIGLGAQDERLSLDGSRLDHSGIERTFLLLKWSRSDRTIHLKDVVCFGKGSAIHPVFFVFAAICAVSLVANVTGQNWWFALGLWRLPYFFVLDTVARQITQNFLAIHGLAVVTYLLLGRLTRTSFLVVDAGDRSVVRFPTAGLPEATVSQFEASFRAEWDRVKAPPAPASAL